MKCAIIAPIDMLTLSRRTDYHMILPDIALRSEVYRNFYRDVKGYKILDNGEAEGHQYDQSVLHDIAFDLGVDEIVIPDVLGSHRDTMDRARDFERFVHAEFNYMGVAQGENLHETIVCASYFGKCDWVTTLGVPRYLNREHRIQRCSLIEAIIKDPDFFRFLPENIHALGGWPAWPREAVLLAGLNIRGIDTSLPLVFGLAGQPIKGMVATINRQKDFFDRTIEMSKPGWRICDRNVEQYIEWCGLTVSEEAPGSEV